MYSCQADFQADVRHNQGMYRLLDSLLTGSILASPSRIALSVFWEVIEGARSEKRLEKTSDGTAKRWSRASMQNVIVPMQAAQCATRSAVTCGAAAGRMLERAEAKIGYEPAAT